MNVSNITAPPVAPPRMTLGGVTKGPIKKPMRILVHGPEGVGKSTLGAGAPSPIFIGAEDGTNTLDVSRFPEPKSLADVREAIRVLTLEKHEYKTLVLDSADWIEPLVWAEVCAEEGKANIEAFGFGKGYVAALAKWQDLMRGDLNRLRDVRGMHILVLAHSHVKNFKNPEADDYDRYQLKTRDNASAFLKEWGDAVLFANFETLIDEKSGRAKGQSTGKRYLFTTRRPAFDAKNRYGLPDKVSLSWRALEDAINAADPKSMRTTAEALIAKIPEDKREAASSYLNECGLDIHKLAACIQRLEELAKTAK